MIRERPIWVSGRCFFSSICQRAPIDGPNELAVEVSDILRVHKLRGYILSWKNLHLHLPRLTLTEPKKHQISDIKTPPTPSHVRARRPNSNPNRPLGKHQSRRSRPLLHRHFAPRPRQHILGHENHARAASLDGRGR